MSRLFLGPGGLPHVFADVGAAIEERFGAAADLGDLELVAGSDVPSVVMCVSDTGYGLDTLHWLNDLSTDFAANVVVVVGDGYLGTDVAERSLATLGAAVVSAVRSLASTRGSNVRANVVCVPEPLLGSVGEHRGPLAHETDASDVAEAVLFLLDEANSYLSGQVLFVDGGRHLFSSHTS